jgi:hypothetical protein
MSIQETAQLLGNLGEFIGAIVVMITLIYLSTQLRDSNNLAQASSLQNVLNRFSDNNMATAITNPESIDIEVRGHRSFEELSVHEQIVFGGFLNRDVFHMQNVMQLYQHGLLEDVDYQAWMAYIAGVVKTPGGSVCWNIMKVSYTPTIVDEIETYLKEHPSAPSRIELYPNWYGAESGSVV